MPRTARLLAAIAAVLLLGAYVFPLWRIGLIAPQYPEGLGMRIHINTVTGATEHDLRNINGLNHYIGMKTIEPDAIPELRFMPWIVAGLIAGAVGVALAGRPRPLYAYAGLFALTGIAGIADFWRWQYDYGHNLDEAAAIIKIPGMSYQPPLIGSKQLLNFTATSLPDVGGIAIGLAMACVGIAAFLTFRGTRAFRRTASIAALAVGSIACTSPEPRAIHFGVENCAWCHMAVSDERYAAQLVTTLGKGLVFDSVECLASHALTLDGDEAPRSAWVSDFARPGSLIPAEAARFVRAETRQSPMGLGLTAFGAHANVADFQQQFGGHQLGWSDVLELVKAEATRRDASRLAPRPG